jgi:serine/threonine protein phosphatase 1
MSPKELILQQVRAAQARHSIKPDESSPTWLQRRINRVLRLDQNHLGRDFAVSDVHGCFALLHTALNMLEFDPTCDRLLCGGDMIDRGPQSHRVLQFLDLPFVHCVKGNHEDLFCSLDPYNLRSLARLNYNGLKWAEKLTNEQVETLQQRLQTLPTAIEVQTAIGPIGMLHAEVPAGMHWSRFCENIEAGESATIESALNGRQRFKAKDITGVPGIQRVFVGHSVVWHGPEVFGNVYAIDCGAAYSVPHPSERRAHSRGFLSITNICMDKTLLAIPYYQQPETVHMKLDCKVTGIIQPFEHVGFDSSCARR